MRWISTLDGGPRRVNHAAASVDDLIYSFGGYCTGEDYKTKRPMDVHILNTVSFRWSALPAAKPGTNQFFSSPFQRYGHTANAYNILIYVWGGRNDIKACNRVFCFDTTVREWTVVVVSGRPPGARDGHSTCIIGDKLYIFGGYEEDLNQFSQETFALNLTTFTWINLKVRGIPPRRRDFHSASAIGQFMFIFGGRSGRTNMFVTPDDEIYCNQLACFDTTTNTWSEVSTNGMKPVGRRSHSAFVYNEQMYIFGGFNGLLNAHYNDIHKFNPITRQWSYIKIKGRLPVARRRQCCCVVGQRLFLFGGTSPSNSPRSTSHRTANNLLANFLEQGLDPNLKDHNDLNVLDFYPTLKTLCLLQVIKYNLDIKMLPREIIWEIEAMTTSNCVSWNCNKAG
ncbi:kelch domain-containing protein 3 [Chamberlinius hualienensis]